jgi:hypothetical protein
MQTKQSDLSVGERWAYRERAVDPPTCVVVTRIGTRQPPRVRVLFLDDDYEGKADWVPPSRLKVPWDQVGSFLERERRLEALVRRSPASDDVPERLAADAVFEAACPPEVLTTGYGQRCGVLEVRDPKAAAEALGVDDEIFSAHPLAFTDDDGTLLAPWDTTLELARSSAPRFAEKILTQVEKDETQAAHEAIYGRLLPGRRGAMDWDLSPETCAATDAVFAPARELLRSWCGAEAVIRRDELVSLRKALVEARAELRKLRPLAERAIGTLEASGLRADARAIGGALGLDGRQVRALGRRHKRTVSRGEL